MKGFDFGIHFMPLGEIIAVWTELVEAYHGVNHFGGNVAELYAYRFHGFSPTAHYHRDTETGKEAVTDLNASAKQAMHSLLLAFRKAFPCRIRIDGVTLNEWRSSGHPFDHRAHVEINKT